jgi:peptidoglycan/xylan/chitin deacetylase (PgdA/CDA1 family)
MELSIEQNTWTLTGASPAAQAREAGHFANDAFSFWKLPQTWRAALAELIEQSEKHIRHYLYEEYLDEHRRRPSRLLSYYYSVKNLIPETLRHRLNSLAINSRPRPSFPGWPCEDALLRQWRRWLAAFLCRAAAEDAWHIGFWPDANRACIVLTHDVESALGLARMERMADLEERYGFRSAWNLALEQYPIDWNLVERLRGRGFEFGAHGLRHDGRLFRSGADFMALAPRLRSLADEHGLRGFRAPSTLRRAEWIPQLGFDFDSSFADTDIFEPQAGGTCSIFPFFLGSVVELPYTLPQDHTLIHLLGRELLPTWTRKARWIASLGGMILTLTHPDYSGEGVYLEAYEGLLKYLAQIDSAWRALPSQVAQWWRRRAAAELHLAGGRPVIEWDQGARASARLVSQEPLYCWESEAWREF